MNRIEAAAIRDENMPAPLEVCGEATTPVLCPIAAGLLVGGAVGYYAAYRHGADLSAEDAPQVDADIREMSVGELLAARQDA